MPTLGAFAKHKNTPKRLSTPFILYGSLSLRALHHTRRRQSWFSWRPYTKPNPRPREPPKPSPDILEARAISLHFLYCTGKHVHSRPPSAGSVLHGMKELVFCGRRSRKKTDCRGQSVGCGVSSTAGLG